MPEADTQGEKDFHLDVPAATDAFFLKGSGAYDGMIALADRCMADYDEDGWTGDTWTDKTWLGPDDSAGGPA